MAKDYVTSFFGGDAETQAGRKFNASRKNPSAYTRNDWSVLGNVATTERNGLTCIIDIDDIELVRKYIFSPSKEGYWAGKIDRKNAVLHRIIMGANRDEVVDHANGNKGDNRKCNLRKCTVAQNSWNSGKRRSGTSQYKGVYLRGRRWHACIMAHAKTVRLGGFDEEIDAAMAYDEAARKYHGEFAKTNFPLKGEENDVALTP